MKKSDLFNEDSICIFTDSSFRSAKLGEQFYPGTTAPAFCVYHGDVCIDQGFHILHNSTSQQGELYAFLLGIMESYKYRNFKHIRIFSDSQNCVMSVREWIFRWVEQNSKGIHSLGEGGRINNQNYLMDIIYTIISNNIYLEIYHVKGHVDIKNRKSVLHAKDVFKRSNPFVGAVDDSIIFQLAMGNNAVDEYSTVMLRSYLNSVEYNTVGMNQAVTIGYIPFDMYNYVTLVNKNGKHLRPAIAFDNAKNTSQVI